jgi:hypothetical protein
MQGDIQHRSGQIAIFWSASIMIWRPSKSSEPTNLTLPPINLKLLPEGCKIVCTLSDIRKKKKQSLSVLSALFPFEKFIVPIVFMLSIVTWPASLKTQSSSELADRLCPRLCSRERFFSRLFAKWPGWPRFRVSRESRTHRSGMAETADESAQWMSAIRRDTFLVHSKRLLPFPDEIPEPIRQYRPLITGFIMCSQKKGSSQFTKSSTSLTFLETGLKSVRTGRHQLYHNISTLTEYLNEILN